MATLSTSNPFFIRCIKPNTEKVGLSPSHTCACDTGLHGHALTQMPNRCLKLRIRAVPPCLPFLLQLFYSWEKPHPTPGKQMERLQCWIWDYRAISTSSSAHEAWRINQACAESRAVVEGAITPVYSACREISSVMNGLCSRHCLLQISGSEAVEVDTSWASHSA